MIRIQKLTPPQISALENAFPGLVGSGMLTTTASIAAFDSATPEIRQQYPFLDFDMTIEKVRQLVWSAFERTGAKPLMKVAAKLATGKDVQVGEHRSPAVAA